MKKNILKILLATSVALSLLAMLYLPVAAITAGQGPDIIQQNLGLHSGTEKYTSVGSLVDVLMNVIKWVYTVFFVVAVLFILLAAYNFIQGGSNPKAVETAKGQLKYAVIAIAVALVASGISVFIQHYLTNPAA